MNCDLFSKLNVTFHDSGTWYLWTSALLRRRQVTLRGARRVLVIEDDKETAEQLKSCLERAGYDVDVASDGAEGLTRALDAAYTVMIVDRLMPRLDGLKVIRRVREQGKGTPALILSALGELDDRVRGLQAGGDDYLAKPFEPREIVARVDALARRSADAIKETVIRVGDLAIDLLARTAYRQGV